MALPVRRPTPPHGRWPAAPGAVAGALCIAFSAILVRLSKESPATAAVFRCAYALPVLGALAVWEARRYGPRPPAERRLALLAGVLFAVDLLCWHQAIADVGAGLGTVLGNLQIVLVGPIAWLVLRERPDARVAAAVPVVLVGVFLISGAVGADAYGRNPARGALFGVLTAVSYAGFILVLRQAGRDLRRLAGPLFEATAVAAVLCAIAGGLLGDVDLVPAWPSHGWLVTLALTSQVLGWLLIAGSLPRLPAVLASVLLTIQPVCSVLLGVVILDEAPSGAQFGGVALVLAGVIGASLVSRRPSVSPPERAALADA